MTVLQGPWQPRVVGDVPRRGLQPVRTDLPEPKSVPLSPPGGLVIPEYSSGDTTGIAAGMQHVRNDERDKIVNWLLKQHASQVSDETIRRIREGEYRK